METARESVPHFPAGTGYSFPDGGFRKVHPGIYV